MKILCYSSCYGDIFKDKFILNNGDTFTCIKWHETFKDQINFDNLINFDILICEYVSSNKRNYYLSNDFIIKIKNKNPNIKIVIYPLIVLNIFPFYKSFDFLSSQSINDLLKNNLNKNEIISLYNNNNIKFKPYDAYKKSINKLKQIELSCDIKVSHIIEEKIHKEIVCIDSIFPSNNIFNYLCDEIVAKLNIDIKINYNNINNFTTNYHINRCYYTNEMIDELKIPNIIPHPNYKNYYLDLLVQYLESKENK